MTSDDLTPFQATELRKQVASHLRYFNRLTDRMTRLGFDPDDSLYQAALKARDSLQDVHVAAHYVSCSSGVGKGGGDEPAAVSRHSLEIMNRCTPASGDCS